MPPLSAKERAHLPDSAFGYIDLRSRRRLPIHDGADVRNALARFSQVVFEDGAARDKARSRPLRRPLGGICFAAHGRQIVMSSAVRAAVIESLAEGVSLRSLGAWRFSRVVRAGGLFQVAAADLPADFSPPRSATAAKERTS